MTIPVIATLQILTVTDTTAGRLALITATTQRGAEPPCHRHHWEDELLYVLEGDLVVWVDGKWSIAPVGEAVFIPRGCEHTFAVLSDHARVLMLYTPAGFEGLYRDLKAQTVWATPDNHDIERWVATAARYGCEITAPHPGRPHKTGVSSQTDVIQ